MKTLYGSSGLNILLYESFLKNELKSKLFDIFFSKSKCIEMIKLILIPNLNGNDDMLIKTSMIRISAEVEQDDINFETSLRWSNEEKDMQVD
jgi:hypothetical protein